MEQLFAWRQNPTPETAIALCRNLTMAGLPSSPADRATLLEVGSAILSRHGDDIEVLLALGRLYLAAGEYLRADAALKRVLDATLSDGRAWRLLGEVFLRAGNARDSQKAFEGAVARGMNDPGTLTWLERARSYVAMQDARGAGAVADGIAHGGTSPSDVMGEPADQATRVQASLHEEATMVAPGLASAGSVMAKSVPDGSVVIAKPVVEPSSGEDPTAQRRVAPVIEPSSAPSLEEERAPDSATLLYRRPEEPKPTPRSVPRPDSHQSRTLTSAPSEISLSPRLAHPAVEVRAAAPAPTPDSSSEPARPKISAVAAPVAPGASAGGVRIEDAQKDQAAKQVLDEMSMSIHMLRPGNVPESDRQMNAYLEAMRKAEGLDIEEPTHAIDRPQQPVPAPPAGAPRALGGGTIPMIAYDEVRRAEQQYDQSARQAQAAFAPPQQMAPPQQALPSVVVAPQGPPPQTPGPQPGFEGPAFAPTALPPPVPLPNPIPTEMRLKAAPRRRGGAIALVVVLFLLVLALAAAWAYLRYFR